LFGLDDDGFDGDLDGPLSRRGSLSGPRRRRSDISDHSFFSSPPPPEDMGPVPHPRLSLDEQGDEGPGSVVWRVKESLREEGALPVLCKVVGRELQGTRADATPNAQMLAQWQLCLDVLESTSFLNTENQDFLTSYRLGGSGGPSQRKEGDRPLAHTLLEILSQLMVWLREEGEGGESAALHDDDDDLADEAGCEDGRFVRRRLLDCLLSVLRVLINLTHHNTRAIAQVVEVRLSDRVQATMSQME
jgi:hypothetical protein